MLEAFGCWHNAEIERYSNQRSDSYQADISPTNAFSYISNRYVLCIYCLFVLCVCFAVCLCLLFCFSDTKHVFLFVRVFLHGCVRSKISKMCFLKFLNPKP